MNKKISILLAFIIIVLSILSPANSEAVYAESEGSYYVSAYTTTKAYSGEMEARNILVECRDNNNRTYILLDDVCFICGMELTYNEDGAPVLSYGRHSVQLGNDRIEVGGKTYYPLKETMDSLQAKYTINENGELIFIPCTSFIENLIDDVTRFVGTSDQDTDFSVKFFDNTWGVLAGAAYNVILGMRYVDVATGDYEKEQYEKAIVGIIATKACESEVIEAISDCDKSISGLYKIGSMKFGKNDKSWLEIGNFLGYGESEFLTRYHEMNNVIPGLGIDDQVSIVRHIYAVQHASELYLNAVDYGLVQNTSLRNKEKCKDGYLIKSVADEVFASYDKNKSTEEQIIDQYMKELQNELGGFKNQKDISDKLLGVSISDGRNEILIGVFKLLLDEYGVSSGPNAAEQGAIAASIQNAAKQNILSLLRYSDRMVDKSVPYKGYSARTATKLKYSAILYLKACNYAYSLCAFDDSLKGACDIMDARTSEAISRLAKYDDGQLEAIVNNELTYIDPSIRSNAKINDLASFYGRNINVAMQFFPNMDSYSSNGMTYYSDRSEVISYELAGPFFDVNSEGTIVGVSYHIGTKYNIFNLTNGMDVKEAIKALKDDKWECTEVGFLHGTAEYYAVYNKEGRNLILSTDEQGDFSRHEEKDVRGHINSLTLSSDTDVAVENNESSMIDVVDYFDNYETLVQLLDMNHVDPWQFMGEDSYCKDDFFLEYINYDWGGRSFSMKNLAATNVVFCGIQLGDSIDDARAKLEASGWRYIGGDDESEEYSSINDESIRVDLKKSNGSVISWYACNWSP